MTYLEMTYKQGKALAAFLRELRGDWDKPGIEHALGVARGKGTAPVVAVAAIRAAAQASNRTPAVIGMDGAHWREPATGQPKATHATLRPPQRHEECPEHGGEWAGTCRGCAADQLAGDETQPAELRRPDRAAQVARVRAELHPRTTETEEKADA